MNGERSTLERLRTKWRQWKPIEERMTREGNRLIVLGRYRVANDRGKKPIEVTMTSVWTLHEGGRVRFVQYVEAPPGPAERVEQTGS